MQPKVFTELEMAHRPVVIVVEDDKEMNQLECELLQIHGIDTVSAYTGPEAVSAAGQRKPDAILLDIMLPEMDGFECCRRLRHQAGEDIPIVMVTALDTEGSRSEGFRAGADAYFTKPFDPYEIVEALRMLLTQAGWNTNGRTED